MTEMLPHAVGWGKQAVNDFVGVSSRRSATPGERDSHPGNAGYKESYTQITAL